MIILVGGSGFIGSYISENLLRDRRDFEVIDLIEPSSSDVVFRSGDIRYPDQIRLPDGTDTIIHLAAVHRDDARPRSSYAQTNVVGTRNVVEAAELTGVRRIIFTSTVAVYGFAGPDANEEAIIAPFNEYGRTKYLAEQILKEWYMRDQKNRSLTILRPTVVFGPKNRGNVYNLINQIHRNRFIMVGSGKNKKSICYVENLVDFMLRCLELPSGARVLNYVDKPDVTMNALVGIVRTALGKGDGVGMRVPRSVGLALGVLADAFSGVTGVSVPLSRVRVEKFTATTTFSSGASAVGFVPKYSVEDALEKTIDQDFLSARDDGRVFFTE